MQLTILSDCTLFSQMWVKYHSMINVYVCFYIYLIYIYGSEKLHTQSCISMHFPDIKLMVFARKCVLHSAAVVGDIGEPASAVQHKVGQWM